MDRAEFEAFGLGTQNLHFDSQTFSRVSRGAYDSLILLEGSTQKSAHLKGSSLVRVVTQFPPKIRYLLAKGHCMER